jgi:Zn finger protein HypA/HybF involved in hydrogenase expression
MRILKKLAILLPTKVCHAKIVDTHDTTMALKASAKFALGLLRIWADGTEALVHRGEQEMSFVCLECGYKFRSAVTAENAAFRDGCPSCGGTDIDLDTGEVRKVSRE